MEQIKLRFAEAGADAGRELPLGPGVHGVGRDGSGALALVDDARQALVQFCVDRRGVWMTVEDQARGVHVNGRPVQRMAMLRVGDSVYVDGVEIVLAGRPAQEVPPKLGSAPVDAVSDPRVVLRGVGGRHHGRSFTLERPRLVGRAADADIRIDDAAFAERHARIDLSGDTILLRDLGSSEGSFVNGEPVRDAVLRPGDQVVFDAHHRFVVEAPAMSMTRDDTPPALGDDDGSYGSHVGIQSTRRLPWLLLAALLIAGALSALLLFGVTA
ncbi:MAG TPA: FHA domain-containing protein [Luteimonas sp.]|nr:FHA domain-containing protein [Luteimonas sp.]